MTQAQGVDDCAGLQHTLVGNRKKKPRWRAPGRYASVRERVASLAFELLALAFETKAERDQIGSHGKMSCERSSG